MRMTERERALEERFEEAERMGLLLWPESNAELKALSRRVQSGRVVRPWTGMYAREGFWETMDGQERKRAVCILKTRALMWPGTVYCGVSAAVLHGLWVSHALLGQIHILSARTRGGADRLVFQVGALPPRTGMPMLHVRCFVPPWPVKR